MTQPYIVNHLLLEEPGWPTHETGLLYDLWSVDVQYFIDSYSLSGGDIPRGARRDGDSPDPARKLNWQARHAAHRGHNPRGEWSRGRQWPTCAPGAAEGLQWEYYTQSPAKLQRHTSTSTGTEKGGFVFWIHPEVIDNLSLVFQSPRPALDEWMKMGGWMFN